MGVRGLETFIERHCPQGADTVDIKHLVETHRREIKKDIVIVVDGSSCLHYLYEGLDWICGGQLREYAERCKHFIEAFAQIGVKLVFFFDGPTQCQKRKVWISRRYQRMKEIFNIYDILARGKSPSEMNYRSIIPVGSMGFVCEVIKKLGCEVHNSTKECDEEIAEYALHHKCFGVLGQDTDFIIYDGPQYYFSVKHFNIQTMTTVNYNRWALARHLRLKPSLLPLLATLTGNDLVSSEDLNDFHQRICANKRQKYLPPKDVIENVARFILNVTNGTNLIADIPIIARKVFGNTEKASSLLTSVKSYDLSVKPVTDVPITGTHGKGPDDIWKQIQSEVKKRLVDTTFNTLTYSIVHDLPYESSTCIEDYRNKEIRPSALMYQQLRQRIYGILLYEKPNNKNYTVEEWIMYGVNSLESSVKVPAIFPPEGSHPGLMELWKNDPNEELIEKKWQLFSWAISSKLDANKIKSIPPFLLAPTTILYYMLHETPRFLDEWEVSAFIAMMVLLPTLDTAVLSALSVKRVNPRALQLSVLFLRPFSLMKVLMDGCGLVDLKSEVSMKENFDGKLFQSLYTQIQSGRLPSEVVNGVGRLEQFNLIKSILLPENI